MAKEVDLIKEKLDLVEFLKGYLNLSPAGRNFKAVCPFHQEKTPSFIVSPERKIWHCFGCGEGGDVIKFVMRYENLEFGEALRFLAEKAGIEMQSLNPREQKEFGILYDIHEVAKDFFVDSLLKNIRASEYLKSRKLDEETIKEFELGFAPGGDSLTVYLLKLGYDMNDIVRAGLAHKNIRGLYKDRFDNRIIFPILNHMGKTVAFTGRLLEGQKSEMPKYLNSPETPIFNKSKILYGFHASKNFIAESKSVFLVEGQVDFLASWQAGIKNVVAVSGTGLTPHHLEKLRRLADSIIISFDNDEAGLKALERSLDIFNNFDFHVKAIDLGEFKDPAEACDKDPLFLKKAIEWAKPAFTHIFDIYFSQKVKDSLGIADKKRLIRYLLSKIKNIKSAVEQNIWLQELSKHSGIAETALISELGNLPAVKEGDIKEEESVKDLVERSDLIAERLLAIAFINQEEFFPILKSHIELLPLAHQMILNNPQNEKANMLEMRSSLEFSDKATLEKEFNDLLKNLELEFLKKETMKFKEAIKIAEEKGDEKVLEEALDKFQDSTKKINDLMRI